MIGLLDTILVFYSGLDSSFEFNLRRFDPSLIHSKKLLFKCVKSDCLYIKIRSDMGNCWVWEMK